MASNRREVKISVHKPPSLRNRVSRWLMRTDEFMPFILIIICVLVARFGSELLVLAVFIATLGIYAWRRYDSRMLVGTAIFLLVVCAVLLAKGSESLANDVAIWAYYFLVIGVLGLFIEYLREGHGD
jgi:hypothetical protein